MSQAPIRHPSAWHHPRGATNETRDRHWILVTLRLVSGRRFDLGAYGGVRGRTIVVLMTVGLVGCGPRAKVGGGGKQDFATRCAQPGVVRCFGFDSDVETPVTPNSNGWPNNFGVTPGSSTTATRDTTIKASGASSLRFTVPSNSGSNAGGNFYANFSPDLQTTFGANSTFYIQWRQRFSREYIAIES